MLNFTSPPHRDPSKLFDLKKKWLADEFLDQNEHDKPLKGNTSFEHYVTINRLTFPLKGGEANFL